MGLTKTERRARIKKRIRKVVNGTADRPRMAVYRSNKQIYAQLMDDVNGVTVASASSVKNDKAQGVPKIDQAKIVGGDIAEKAKSAGIENSDPSISCLFSSICRQTKPVSLPPSAW